MTIGSGDVAISTSKAVWVAVAIRAVIGAAIAWLALGTGMWAVQAAGVAFGLTIVITPIIRAFVTGPSMVQRAATDDEFLEGDDE